MRLRLTSLADRDLEATFRQTLRLFGPLQVERYAAIVDRGLAMICENPVRPSSHEREELGAGVRSFHLQIAAGRRKGAAHIVYYVVLAEADGEGEVIVLRVLADEMEPLKRVSRALRDEK